MGLAKRLTGLMDLVIMAAGIEEVSEEEMVKVTMKDGDDDDDQFIVGPESNHSMI